MADEKCESDSYSGEDLPPTPDSTTENNFDSIRSAGEAILRKFGEADVSIRRFFNDNRKKFPFYYVIKISNTSHDKIDWTILNSADLQSVSKVSGFIEDDKHRYIGIEFKPNTTERLVIIEITSMGDAETFPVPFPHES